MEREHIFISDTRDWHDERPLMAAVDDIPHLSHRLIGELKELGDVLPTALFWNFVPEKEHAVRETPDIGVFATNLWLKLIDLGVNTGDFNSFLHSLSANPPKMTIREVRTKITQLQREISTHRIKYLHIQEAIFIAWATARALGRGYEEEFILKTGYNRKRYDKERLQLDDLKPEDYTSAFQERIREMSQYAKKTGMEDAYYTSHRMPERHSRLRRVITPVYRVAHAFASLITTGL